MSFQKDAALIVSLIEELESRGSWCGETHVQKSAYFLKELFDAPLSAEFTLYKHGPFSFDLRGELNSMRGYGLIELKPQPYPYGPSLTTTEDAGKLKERFPKTLARYASPIEFVADRLAHLGVTELERLATALFVERERPGLSLDDSVDRITQLKPHLSREDVSQAVKEIRKLQTAIK